MLEPWTATETALTFAVSILGDADGDAVASSLASQAAALLAPLGTTRVACAPTAYASVILSVWSSNAAAAAVEAALRNKELVCAGARCRARLASSASRQGPARARRPPLGRVRRRRLAKTLARLRRTVARGRRVRSARVTEASRSRRRRTCRRARLAGAGPRCGGAQILEVQRPSTCESATASTVESATARASSAATAMLRLVAIACLAAGAAALSARPTASARTNLLQVLAREIPVPERFTASVAGQSSIEEAVANLEKAASKDDLPSFPRDLMLIDGEWTLKYTNNALPPPPDWAPSAAGRLAGRDVVQRIDVMNRRVVNCVTLNPWPVGDDVPGGELLEKLPLVGGPIAALAKASVRLELDHAFTVEGDGSDGGPRRAAGTNRLKIALERVERTLSGLDESASPLFATFLPTFSEVDVPEPVRAANAALAATALGGGLFDTTYCDDTIRVSRGTNPLLRELRVFVKADAQIDADDAVPEPYEDRFASAPPGEDDGDPADSIPSD